MKSNAINNGKRVVITGFGPVAPCGIGKEEFWKAIKSGKSYVSRLNSLDVSDLNVELKNVDGFKSQVAGIIKSFDPGKFGLKRQDLRSMDRFIRFAFAGSKLAIEDARLDLERVDHNKIGVSIGTAIAGAKMINEEYEIITNMFESQVNPDAANRFLYYNAVPCFANSVVAAHYNLHGPAVCISTGCASGIDSIGYAKALIENGAVDVMVCGSFDAAITPTTIASFDVVGALAARNHEPEKASRPFDRERDGFVLAEGGGVVILESLEHALSRNTSIYAELFGYGTTMNAYHMTALDEEGEDLADAIRLAINGSPFKLSDYNYINAHGSSTPQNDINETAAYKTVFGDCIFHIPISSTKSVFGHAMGGASSIEIIVCALSIDDSFLPPTINYEVPDPKCDLDYVPNIGREMEVNVVLTTASSFSGIHSALVLGKCRV